VKPDGLYSVPFLFHYIRSIVLLRHLSSPAPD